jgi:hypothetical protein
MILAILTVISLLPSEEVDFSLLSTSHSPVKRGVSTPLCILRRLEPNEPSFRLFPPIFSPVERTN